MIEGYLALTAGDDPGAAALFEKAAAALAQRAPARDVPETREMLEALVGFAASSCRGVGREAVLVRIARVCRRAGMHLLPRDRALLIRPQPPA